MKSIRTYPVVLFCCLAGSGLASEPSLPSAAGPASVFRFDPQRAQEISEAAERQQEQLSGRVERAADRLDRFLFNLSAPSNARRDATFDRFFDDRRVDVSEQGTVLRLSPGVALKSGDGLDATFRTAVRLHLPRFENQVDLMIANFGEDDSADDSFRTGSLSETPLEEETDASIRIRAILQETRRLRFSVSAGVNLRPQPVPTLSARLRLEEREGIYVRRLTPTLIWDGRDGFGQNTRLDLERHPAPEWKQRSRTFLLWSETSEGIRASQTLSLMHTPNRTRFHALHAGASGMLEPSTKVTEYVIR